MLLSFSTKFVIQSEAKNLGNINMDVIEILPPFGRLNDNKNKLNNINKQI